MSPTLEDQERHLLVKVIDRILYKLDDLVRPYVHKILVVIEPLLIDEDYYARVEGREIISNLAKVCAIVQCEAYRVLVETGPSTLLVKVSDSKCCFYAAPLSKVSFDTRNMKPSLLNLHSELQYIPF